MQFNGSFGNIEACLGFQVQSNNPASWNMEIVLWTIFLLAFVLDQAFCASGGWGLHRLLNPSSTLDKVLEPLRPCVSNPLFRV